MKDQTPMQYVETVSCEPSKEEGLIFMKVIAMPHGDPVEFNVEEARKFARQILAAVAEVESGWMGGSGNSDRGA